MSLTHLLVYGTLRRQGTNHPVLSTLRPAPRYVATTAFGGFKLIDLGPFPGLLIRPGWAAVTFELFEIDESHLPALDRFEGAPHLYQRVLIEADDVRAWVYLFNGDHDAGSEIVIGDWIAWIRDRAPQPVGYP